MSRTSPLSHDALPATRRDALKLGAIGLATGGLALTARPTPTHAQAAPVDVEGPLPGGVFRAEVGAITAYLIADGVLRFPLLPTFAANADPAAAKAQLEARFLPAEGPGPVPVNAMLVVAPNATILIDSGAGGGFQDSAGYVANRLAALGVAELDGVVVTHLHADHVRGLATATPEAGGPLATAPVMITKTEREFWAGKPDLAASLMPEEMKAGTVDNAIGFLDALDGRLQGVAMDEALAEGVTLVPLPGHTPGHVGVRLESQGQQLLYFTDLLHVAGMQFARPDWYAFFDADGKRAIKTRRATLDAIVADRTLVAGTHMPWPGVGHVRADGAGYAWDPVVWTY